jgi:hypothetical protein
VDVDVDAVFVLVVGGLGESLAIMVDGVQGKGTGTACMEGVGAGGGEVRPRE